MTLVFVEILNGSQYPFMRNITAIRFERLLHRFVLLLSAPAILIISHIASKRLATRWSKDFSISSGDLFEDMKVALQFSSLSSIIKSKVLTAKSLSRPPIPTH